MKKKNLVVLILCMMIITGICIPARAEEECVVVSSLAGESVTEEMVVGEQNAVYQVQYSLNGGKNSTSNPKIYDSTAGSLVLAQPQKSMYVFDGWYADKKFTTKIDTLSNNTILQYGYQKKGVVKGIRLYAKWHSAQKEYGVFLGVSPSKKALNRMKKYQKVVLDADYFSAEDIKVLKDANCIVYSYLDIGSLENFRSYYDRFKDLPNFILGKYENWDEEVWINPANKSWQQLILNEIAPDYLDKGIDGFFIDNTDTYYYALEELKNQDLADEVFGGLNTILHQLYLSGKEVIINGGDTYVTAYDDKYHSVTDILTGINQETVFSAIDFDHRRLGTANDENREYYQSYIERFSDQADIYLLEYTKNSKLKKKIFNYCREHGFQFYASSTIELK